MDVGRKAIWGSTRERVLLLIVSVARAITTWIIVQGGKFAIMREKGRITPRANEESE